MKILLINPPAENEVLTCNLEIVEEERGHNPPLGILYIAGYLEKNSSFQIKIIDMPAEGLSLEGLKKQAGDYGPDVAGITTMTFTLIDAMNVAGAVKQVCPGAKVVLGGPHVSIYPDETIKLPGIDYLVLGEGEVTFLRLLENINDTGRLKEIKGLVFKEDGRIINTGAPDFIGNLDDLPFPARGLSPYKKYSSLLASESPITTMFTSRGCPYRCSFCNRPNMGKIFRAISANRVVDEMEECKRMGIKEIFFYDDTFTIDKKRVYAICDQIVKRGVRIPWDIRTRVDNVDKEILAELKQANCQRIHFGVESASPRILKLLRKDIDLKRAVEVFKTAKAMGISTFGYFMIGSPTETREEILATIDFAKRLDPDYVQVTIFTPFPGTPIYDEGLKNGVFTHDYWKEFSAHPTNDFRSKYWEGDLSGDDLKAMLVRAYKEFYTRPGYIISRLLRTRTFGELKRKIVAGLHVLKMR